MPFFFLFVSRAEPLEASRCFNCGSYSHSLKDCPRPRDSAAISLARRQHSSRRTSASGQRGQSRYYQISAGKFDGLRAGVLGPELRESLGIGVMDLLLLIFLLLVLLMIKFTS